MANLAAFLTMLVLGCAVVGYAIFARRRFGPVGPWPHGWRLALLWLAALVGVAAFAGGCLLIGVLGGFVYCSAQFSPTDAWPCTLAGRLAYGIGSLAIGLPVFFLWMRVTHRVLSSEAQP
jgi:hypothetical protein